MRFLTVAFAVVSVSVCSLGHCRDDELAKLRAKQPIAAAVHYDDMMLIVKTEQGTAALVFHEPSENGVKYKFRLLQNKDMKESNGHGEVFEKYKSKPGGRPNEVIDDGGKLEIAIGKANLAHV